MSKDFAFVTKIKSVIHEVHSLHNINKMITWKHRQLDTDNDSLLGPNEIQHVESIYWKGAIQITTFT